MTSRPDIPERVELLHGELVIADWSYCGEAMDGSGSVYLHRQFSYNALHQRAEAVREVDVMCLESIARLLALPGIRVQDA